MTIRQLIGDCRALLPSLPDESVHCVVTSPPYWGLRDYGTTIWEGGDAACDHTGVARRCDKPGRTDKQSTQKGSSSDRVSRECLHCGARRIDSQIGLEPTYQEHVEAMVAVFREVRRVLRKDGTLWLNYGDSYATSVNGRSAADTKATGNDDRTFRDKPFSTVSPEWKSRVGVSGNKGNSGADHEFRVAAQGVLKPKDLCGIPWRVAFALQADGWWLRQDIIWSKPNPMPESVTDRCTKAHEYLFMFAKSERYFYDAAAIKEPMKDVSLQRLSQPNVLEQPGGPKDPKSGNRSHKKAINNQAERLIKHEKWETRFEGWDTYDKSLGRNKRSVWEIATQPYSEAHFATFPPALIEPCILAGCPAKACAKCGAPWVREVEREFVPTQNPDFTKGGVRGLDASNGWGNVPRGRIESTTRGFSPSCACDAGMVPGIVLDPFGGAGTTGLVADRLQRNAILIDLNGKYAGMAAERIRGDAPLFVDLE